jgi:hypothetical protein
LEAAIGVEPMMEVLQTSLGGAQEWSLTRDCAAQSKVLHGVAARWCVAVMGHDEASRRQLVGNNGGDSA